MISGAKSHAAISIEAERLFWTVALDDHLLDTATPKVIRDMRARRILEEIEQADYEIGKRPPSAVAA
jgi:hypothetical protein